MNANGWWLTAYMPMLVRRSVVKKLLTHSVSSLSVLGLWPAVCQLKMAQDTAIRSLDWCHYRNNKTLYLLWAVWLESHPMNRPIHPSPSSCSVELIGLQWSFITICRVIRGQAYTAYWHRHCSWCLLLYIFRNTQLEWHCIA